MNKFQRQYQYSKFTIVFNGHNILIGLTYDELCEWLILSKNRLFGHYVRTLNSWWQAEEFLRYETEIKL
jgi:hypothetical protein